LEGSRHHSNGARVNLDLSTLTSTGTSYSLFPGQIIAVEGLNSSGRKMVAQRICEGSAREPVKSTVDELMRYHHGPTDEAGQDGKPVKIMAMSGPYTTSDSLDYEPLLDALNQIRVDRPDVVIMTGPFVDMRQPNIASGNIVLEFEDGGGKMNVTTEALFVNKVAAAIESLYEEDPNMRTQFILQPSLDDAVAEFVYPQPPLHDRLKRPKEMQLPGAEGIEYGTLGLQHVETAGRGDEEGFKRVHCVSNPCTLKINEMTVGVTSTDVMLHISTDETNANLEPGSRMARMAQHLLQQRSYYPLFPPPAAQTMATNLDLAHMKEWSMPCQPDLLIVPSKLATFAKKVLDHSVVVNPGLLTRGTTGGTYAMMDVHPMKRDVLEGAGGDIEMDHGIPDRIKIDIKRI
jgi:DNA polymerase alpha subunit B